MTQYHSLSQVAFFTRVCKVFFTISVNFGISYFLCVRNRGFRGLHGVRG